MKLSDFKPCPFCGGSGEIFVKTTSARGLTRGWEFGVWCSKCGVTLPKQTYTLEVQLCANGEISTLMDERDLALEDWNRRIGDDCNS